MRSQPESPSAVASLWRRSSVAPAAGTAGAAIERVAGRVHLAQRSPPNGKLPRSGKKSAFPRAESRLEDRRGVFLAATVGKARGPSGRATSAPSASASRRRRDRGLRTARPRVRAQPRSTRKNGVLRFPTGRFREGGHGLRPLAQRRMRRADGMPRAQRPSAPARAQAPSPASAPHPAHPSRCDRGWVSSPPRRQKGNPGPSPPRAQACGRGDAREHPPCRACQIAASGGLGLQRGPERCLGPGRISLVCKDSALLKTGLPPAPERARRMRSLDGQCRLDIAGLLAIERLLVEPRDLRLRWREASRHADWLSLSSITSKGTARSILRAPDDQRRAHARDIGRGRQRPGQKALEGRKIRRHAFQDEVDLTVEHCGTRARAASRDKAPRRRRGPPRPGSRGRPWAKT